MNQTTLTDALSSLPIGRAVFFKTIGSTNDLAGKWAEEGAPDLSLVTADEQTQGRGRAGNKWYTFPGSALAFSLLMHPPKDVEAKAIQKYTGLGAVAVCEALERIYQLRPEIKWPNDILLGGNKTCGVLAEAHWLGDNLTGIILGIGINVTKNSIPPLNNHALQATCIEEHITENVDRLHLLKEVLSRIIFWKPQIDSQDFLATWENRLAYKNMPIDLISKNNTIQTAKLKHLAHDGSLIVEYDDKSEKQITAGEIHLRPSVDK